MHLVVPQVSQDQVELLWRPQVGFINTDDIQHTEVDEDAVTTVLRRDTNFIPDLSNAFEVEIYRGDANPVSTSRKYSTIFTCNFDLVLYPFDIQMCFMRLQILSASSEYLIFNATNSHVAYLGQKLLVEYGIGKIDLEVDDTKQYSEIRVQVELIRRYGYAMLNIYIPSLTLLTISFVTLFFRAPIFEVDYDAPNSQSWVKQTSSSAGSSLVKVIPASGSIPVLPIPFVDKFSKVKFNLKFYILLSRYPGSTHDSFIWNNCALRAKFAEGDFLDCHLLGDSGYPLERYLLTPFANPMTRGEERFNRSHTRTRVLIEQTFDLLKSRFRCLHQSGRSLQYEPRKCGKIITACILLHNRCVRRRIPLPEAEAEAEGGEEEDPDDPEPLEAAGARQGRAAGQQARNNVVDNVFS
ncbi:hypothetical protein Pcinc_000117 [Petrolisthes cinctipes]|uniref:DDE Tnp4 domain-containing protein n=1 Tax=Petrolisthes cinctipes TaxID=88211 RepID=A0AAE1GQ55_PETCI|nr:hypothetical protein Pcinc_000117 [Petrolisthes cinctipes]